MLRRKSTHKRKRSSARADQTKKSDSGRIIANTIWKHQGKNKIESQDSTQSRLLQCIDIPLLHSLDVLIPCPSSSTSASLNRLIDSLSHTSKDEQLQRTRGATYLIQNAPLSLFLDPAFLTSHIRSGTLTMISSGSLDSEDVVCLDGKGTLILSVTKETYQTLGLTGRPSRFSRGSSGWAGDRRSGKHQRFIIEIDLLSPTFTPVHKGYKNVKERLDGWDLNRRSSNESSKPTSRSGGNAQDGKKDELSSLLDVLNSGEPSTSTSNKGTTPSQEGQKSENGATKIGSWDLLLNWVPSPQSIQSSSSSTSTSNLNAEPTFPTIHFPPHFLPILQPREIKQEIRSRVEEDVFIPDFNSKSSIDHPERDTLYDLVHGWKEDHKEMKSSEKKFDRSEKDGMDLDEADPLAGEEDTAASILAFEEWKERILGLGEWAGMNLDERGSEKFKTFNRFSTYTSSYSPSFPLTQGKLIHLSFKGILGPQFVQCVNEKIDGWIKEARKASRKTNGKDELLWSISLAKCFKDSPISWNLGNKKKKNQDFEGKGKAKETGEDQGVEPNDLEEEGFDTRERKRVRFSEVGKGQDQEQSLILEDGDEEDDDEDDSEDEGFQSESEEEQSSSSDEDEEKETPESSHQASNSSSKPFSKDKERNKRKKRGFVRSGERERATRFGRDDSTGFLVLSFGDQHCEDEGQVELEAKADEVEVTTAGKNRRRDGTEIEGQKRKELEAVEKVWETRRRARWIVLEGVGLDLRN